MEVLGDSQVNGSPTCQTRFEQHQDVPGCLKLLGGIRMKWQTHRGSVHQLRLWTPAGKSWALRDTDPDSLWSAWRVVLCERPGACLSGRLEQEEIFKKTKKVLSGYLENSATAATPTFPGCFGAASLASVVGLPLPIGLWLCPYPGHSSRGCPTTPATPVVCN